MRYLSLAILLTLTACGDVRVEKPALVGEVTAALSTTKPTTQASTPAVNDAVTKEREERIAAERKQREAEDKAVAAIKTSQDAKTVIEALNAANDADKKAIAEREAQIKILKKESSRLHQAEVARIISLCSWIVFAAGLLTTVIGGYLFFRGLITLARTLFFGGLGTILLGLFGVWAAPAWMTIAWSFGIFLLVVGVAVLIYEIESHKKQIVALKGSIP